MTSASGDGKNFFYETDEYSLGDYLCNGYFVFHILCIFLLYRHNIV